MTKKDELLTLLEQMKPAQVRALLEFMLGEFTAEQMEEAVEEAYWILEPDTLPPETVAELDEIEAEMDRGEFVTHDELKRKLGL